MKTFLNILLQLCFFVLPGIVFSQTCMDFDGNIYKCVTINKIIWITENFKGTHYRNGDMIPKAKNEDEWKEYNKKEIGCWACYNYDSTICHKFGVIYNGFAIMDKRGIAPLGWHLPSFSEGCDLILNLPSGFCLKSTTGWDRIIGSSEYGNGSNSSGFNSFPCGQISKKGKSINWGWSVYYWYTKIDVSWGEANMFGLHFNYNEVHNEYSSKDRGNYLRLIKD